MAMNPKAIGQRIQHQRKALDLTQAQLAEQARLDTTYLSQVERGVRTLSLDALDRICTALKVRPGVLLDGEASTKDGPLSEEIKTILARLTPKQRLLALNTIRSLVGLRSQK